jgi:signal transduction histidine kinase
LELSLARWTTAEGTFFTGIIRDITERKEAAEALRRMNQELERRVQERTRELAEKGRIVEAFYSTAINPVVFLDREFNFIRVNEAYAKACARDVSEFIGKNHFEMYPGELKADFERVLRDKKPWQTFARPFVFPDHPEWGVTYWDMGLVPVLDDRGGVDFLVLSLNDVTARQAAEQARDKLQEQLYQTQKMEAIGQLAAGLGHDFGNLLATILDRALRAKESLHDPAAVSLSLDALEGAAMQARGIIQSLLTFSCQTAVRRQPVKLCAVLDESAYLLRRTLPSSIKLITELAELPLWVNADPVQMEQVLVNLAINARDAMPNGGSLEIVLMPVGESGVGHASASKPRARLAQLVVRDTGVGMSEDVRSRVFDPYFTTKPRGKGTGLGLSIVHGIVEEMGGRIDVESQVAKGTTFTILLPCIEPPTPVETQEAAPLAIAQAQDQQVLLAGGHPYERGMVGAMLRLLGFQVIQAEEESALEACFSGHRDDVRLIVIDEDGLNGQASDWALALRASGLAAPIVVISNQAEAEPSQGFEEGVATLRKPFGIPELRSVVCDVLGIR